MWQTVILSFCCGIFAANGTPHFVKGIMRETYPSALGYTPGVNLVGGWAMYVIATVCGFAAHFGAHPQAAAVATALGVLPMGLFHATIGAFGRKPPEVAGRPGR